MTVEIIERLKALTQEGSCRKKQVACIILKGEEVLVEAANGRPGGESCVAGFCHRCKAADLFPRGRDHDLCSCLHAEQNAITEAARLGIALQGATLLSTYQPCLTCLKLSVGAGIIKVRFLEKWTVPTVTEIPNLLQDYESLESYLPEGSDFLR